MDEEIKEKVQGVVEDEEEDDSSSEDVEDEENQNDDLASNMDEESKEKQGVDEDDSSSENDSDDEEDPQRYHMLNLQYGNLHLQQYIQAMGMEMFRQEEQRQNGEVEERSQMNE